jgi:alpha-beta hydrolase superfamily lysophospholipase
VPEHIEGHLTGQGGLRLYWQGWLPAADPRAAVVISHGAFEHGARYAHVGDALAQAGFATYTVDHRGHGRSEGQRGYIDRMANVVADLGALVALVGDRHPGARRFLLGHSAGGGIALQYTLDGGARDLDGLILSAPTVDVSAVSGLQLRIAKLLSAVLPKAGMVAIDSAGVSRDPEVVRAYDADPLVYHGKGPIRSIAEVLGAAQRFPERVDRLELPVLLMHGTADTLVSVAGTKLVAERASSTDKTLKLYDGLYHEILNEPEQDEVIADIVAWLQARS